MSLKQFGGVFGRNPTFNDVTIEGDLILNGDTFTGLDYQGTWNASTNTPALTGGSGTTGEFYIVSVAGATDLDGITNWAVGDWAMFNGTAWQRIEGGANGNFVDLSASGNVTLSGGTANGVLYLDGSKVATSGSALTFDGTNLGVGTAALVNSSGYATFSLNGATGGQIAFKSADTAKQYIFSSASDLVNRNDGTSPTYQWNFSGSEQMRLDNTGLGIGTSSPSTKLDVSGQVTTRGSVAAFVAQPRDGSGAEWSIYNPTGDDLRFFGNSDDRMVLNNSGNLGIGTSSPGNKLHVSGSGDVARFTNGSNSAYFALDSAGFTLFTGAAQTGNGLYAKASDNSLQFWTGSNSKMVIDSSGNVGIGTSSPDSKLNVVGATAGTGPAGLRIGYAGTSVNFIDADTQYFRTGAGSNSLIIADTVQQYFISGSEQMRLTSTGLGIGTSSPGSFDGSADNLVVGTTSGNNGITIAAGTTGSSTINFADGTAGGAQYAGYIDYQHNGDYMRFGTNGGTERMRIKSTGQTRFVPLAADPAGAEAGDVYYNSSTNKLRLYDGSSWVDLN